MLTARDALALALALACAALASVDGGRLRFTPGGTFDARADARVALDGRGGVVVVDGDDVVFHARARGRRGSGDGDGGADADAGAEARRARAGRAAAIGAGDAKCGRRTVVVTRDGVVVAYDAVGREVWRAEGAGGRRGTAAEAAAAVSRTTARAGDGGLVVVGVRYELDARAAEDGAMSTSDSIEGALGTEARVGGFEYVAFDAATGETRWRSNASDEAEDTDAGKGPLERSKLIFLDDDEVEDARERTCADFRESIVRDGLPHQWRYEGDTTIRFAHFKRHPSRANEMRRGRRAKGGGVRLSRDPAAVPANAATRAFGRAVDALRGTRSPRRSSAARRDANAEEHPNVVVSHHSEGVDFLHLYSGAILCSLELKSPGLHADVDGDGVMDHVEAHGRNSVRDDLPSCWATVTSGVASEGRTLSASVCRGGSGLAGHRAAQAAGFDLRSVEVTPPVSLRRLPETASEFAKAPDGLGRDLIFLNSRGEMTCFNARDGEQRRWQIRTTAEWNSGGEVVPSLTSFPLHASGRLDLAVAVGAKSIVVINSKGYRAAPPIEIPAPPAAPLVVADFDGDGLTDLILRTRYNVYVWTQNPRAGNLPLTFLILAMAVTMALAFARQLREALADGETAVVRSTSLDVDELDARDTAHPDSDSDSDSAHLTRSKRL